MSFIPKAFCTSDPIFLTAVAQINHSRRTTNCSFQRADVATPGEHFSSHLCVQQPVGRAVPPPLRSFAILRCTLTLHAHQLLSQKFSSSPRQNDRLWFITLPSDTFLWRRENSRGFAQFGDIRLRNYRENKQKRASCSGSISPRKATQERINPVQW